MKLIEYENYTVKVTDEAFLIRPIRKLFNQDKSATKEKFFQQMSYMYFMVSPSSTYNYIVDENERSKEIIKQEGLPSDFKPSKDLEEAMEVYKKHTKTAASMLLEDAIYTAEQVRTALRSVDLKNIADLNDRVNAIKAATSTLSMIPKVVEDLIKAENAMKQEELDSSRMRGGAEKSIFEDGIKF